MVACGVAWFVAMRGTYLARREPMLNDVCLRRGAWAQRGRPDEVIASETFAAANGLGLGDRVEAVINGRWRRLTIVGIGLSPEFIYEVVSALGVEEQRVDVVADVVDPPGPLGDGYRVDARMVIWRGDDMLVAPASAVFPRGDVTSVFVVAGGRAERRDVTVGHRSSLAVEITAGLMAGDVVIRHPSNDVEDGVRVRPR